MGSRITRAVFKDERSRPLDKSKAEDIANLATLFFSFIACLFFFLFGYLYRPYLKEQPTLYLTAFLLYLSTPKFPPATKTILLSLLLFILILVSKISGVGFFFLKGGVILSAVLFATISNCDLVGNPFRQALLVWSQYECFWLGLSLSLDVERINLQAGRAGEGEDSMLVKCLFSLIGLMAFTLASFGKGFLRKHLEQSNKETELKQQIPAALLTFAILLCCLGIKGGLALSFLLKCVALFVSVAIMAASRKINI
jgi:hypothetical protein